MSEESATNLLAEHEAEAGVAPVEEVTEDILLTDAEQLEDGEESPVIDDTEEVEFNGTKARIPKAMKDAFLMHQDYTKKTQELAEQRRSLEQERTQHVQRTQEEMIGVARLIAMDERINAYGQVDWQALSDQDPIKAQQAFMDFTQLKETRQNLAGHLAQQEQRKAIERQQFTAKQIEEGQAVLARDIKGWSKEVEDKLANYAVSELGFKPQELPYFVAEPRAGKLLHAAWVGSELVKKQKASSQQPAEQIKPVKQVGNASPASPTGKYRPEMTDREWNEYRRKQIAQRH